MDEISGRIGAIHPIDKGLNPLPKKSGPIGNRAFSQCSLPCQTISDSANFQSPFFIQETKLVSRYHLSLFDADTYRVAESHPSELPKPEETKEHHCSLKASH